MSNVRRSYSEELKRHVVEEVESGSMSRVDVSREYGIPKCMVRHWLEEYGKFQPKRDVVEVVMKSEKERIAELEKALSDAHIKNRLYEEIINLAEKEYKLDLKKTFGTKPSESSGEKATSTSKTSPTPSFTSRFPSGHDRIEAPL